MSTLPQVAFDILPFSDEPMSQWKKDTDIRSFVNALYSSFEYQSHAEELCAEEEKAMREWASSFTKNLMEASLTSTHLDFYQDARFGRATKYVIALKCCIHHLLEDAGFYSLAHLLESESDIECSLLLASNFYYKQAIQMLRNILEEVFLPIQFCDNVSDFDAWKANSYRTPKLRGSDGLINQLLKKNILPSSLGTQIANLYGNLSAYVHGSESTLIHQNIHLGEVHRVEFNPNAFTVWCNFFCMCLDACLRLLKINYDQWHTIRSFKFETLAKVGKTLCHTCHNEDGFDKWLLPSKYCYTEYKEQGQKTGILENVKGLFFYHYVCQHCGHTTTVNANETPLTLVLCLSTDGLPPGSAITDFAYLVRGTEDSYCEWYTVQPEGADVTRPLLIHIDD